MTAALHGAWVCAQLAGCIALILAASAVAAILTGRVFALGDTQPDFTPDDLDEPISYIPAPPEAEWPVATEIAMLQALWVVRPTLALPVLCDEIADRRRAKAGQS